MKKTSPLAGKIGTALVLANAMPTHLQGSGGTTIIKQIIGGKKPLPATNPDS